MHTFGGAPWAPTGTVTDGARPALRVHMYAFNRPIVNADPTVDAETQDTTIDLRFSSYAPVLYWAQRQVVPAFGQAQ